MIDLGDAVRAQDLSALQRWLDDTGTLDIAEELIRLDRTAMAVVFRLLPRDRALAVFETLDASHQHDILEGLRDDNFRHLVEEMDPDDRARLLEELPATVASRVLEDLSHEERAMTAALLGYPEESAGRIMSPEYVSLRASATVADALAKVRRDGAGAETVYALPVTDDERHLIGIVGLRALVLADASERVGDLMSTDVYVVGAHEDQERAARLIQDASLLALPVVDSEQRLVGVITVDDAMDVIEAEYTEDAALSGATQPLRRPYLSASVFGLARSRGVWLLILGIAAVFTVQVLQVFEGTLETRVTLAAFIPLLIGTGGNAGAQASAGAIRAMAIGEVRFSDLPRLMAREARVGLLLGVMLAAAAFVPVAVIFELRMAIVVSTTLVAICAWATFAGSLLPMIAHRVGVDPAVVSAPLITTLVDATGLIIYFLIAEAVFSA